MINNLKTTQKCAFCKYWYDPTNTAIAPKSPRINLWVIVDPKCKNKCFLKNFETKAINSCNRFECKLQIM